MGNIWNKQLVYVAKAENNIKSVMNQDVNMYLAASEAGLGNFSFSRCVMQPYQSYFYMKNVLLLEFIMISSWYHSDSAVQILHIC